MWSPPLLAMSSPGGERGPGLPHRGTDPSCSRCPDPPQLEEGEAGGRRRREKLEEEEGEQGQDFADNPIACSYCGTLGRRGPVRRLRLSWRRAGT